MLRFAVAGSPLSTPSPGGSVEGIRRAAELGIRAMELEWVQRVPENPERMREIREAAESNDVTLTVHAPYFINLNAKEEEKLVASRKRILTAMAMADLCGAVSVCVHPAFYVGDEPSIAFVNVRNQTELIVTEARKNGLKANLAFETMGKVTQFGTLEEILKLCKEFDIYPCIDPAHMHARTNGAWNTTEEWNTMFDMLQKALGKKALTHVHMHYSGINYTEKGERNHLPFHESDARWQDFLQVLKDRNIGGTVVCESPAMEEDTLLLQRTYAKLR